MTTITLPKPNPQSPTIEQARPLSEHRVILHNVSWHTFRYMRYTK